MDSLYRVAQQYGRSKNISYNEMFPLTEWNLVQYVHSHYHTTSYYLMDKGTSNTVDKKLSYETTKKHSAHINVKLIKKW